LFLQMTEIRDRFGPSLCGNDKLRTIGRNPHLGYCEETLGERILTNDPPTGMLVLCTL
jgi:hypothetical protein